MKHRSISVKESRNRVTVQHPQMRVIFNLKDGTWSAFDRSTGKALLRDAGFRLDSRGVRAWGHPPATYSAGIRERKAASGTRVTVTVRERPSALYRPAMAVSYTFHSDRSAMEIGWSVRNTQKHEIRVRDVEPVYHGALLPDAKLTDLQHLCGGAGKDANLVTDGWQVEAHNSAMATGLSGATRVTVVAGGLGYAEFARDVEILPGEKVWGNARSSRIQPAEGHYLTLAVWDPQGKRIAPGATYRAKDTCYLDLLTADPFEALERYGLSLRAANKANPHSYDFPTLCGWMVSTRRLGEGKRINHSTGLVDQVDLARERGLLKYTPLAPRLEPDYYCYPQQGNTQQGWWDDEHFARYGALTEPYETFEKWCQAVADRGCIPFTYFQSSMPSNDFALAHPGWMLNNDITDLHRHHAHHRPYVRYDYTDPGFQKHMRSVWARMRKAGLKGVKFDYPETGWNPLGGFDDPSYTTTSAYRTIFKLCKDGLGKDSYIHERNLGGATHEDAPCLDVTAGIADLQRVWGDASHFEPEMASRMGLRWYKSRSVFHYYPDGKSFVQNGKALPAHQRRAFLTLIGLLGGRIEIGTSIGSMTDAMFHDLTRLYPIFDGIRSPRPVDMLCGKAHPEVYSYAVTPDWHQVLLVNNGKRRKTVQTRIAGSHAEDGGLQLDRKARYHAFDFWSQAYLGCLRGSEALQASLRAGEVAMISLRRALQHPQVISTNRHVMQGMVECHRIAWGEKGLTGSVDVVGGEPFVLTVALNRRRVSSVKVNRGSCEMVPRDKGTVDLVFASEANQRVRFALS